MPRYKFRGDDFDRAASEAKHLLYPEAFWSREAPAITVCRMCDGQGYHHEGCAFLDASDGKKDIRVEDILRVTDKPKETAELPTFEISTDKEGKKKVIEPKNEPTKSPMNVFKGSPLDITFRA